MCDMEKRSRVTNRKNKPRNEGASGFQNSLPGSTIKDLLARDLLWEHDAQAWSSLMKKNLKWIVVLVAFDEEDVPPHVLKERIDAKDSSPHSCAAAS